MTNQYVQGILLAMLFNFIGKNFIGQYSVGQYSVGQYWGKQKHGTQIREQFRQWVFSVKVTYQRRSALIL
jgi:hypothetical protein